MVEEAKLVSKDPSDGLTCDESASVRLYTMKSFEGHDSFYTLLNEKLRSKNRNELESWHSYLKLFLTALYKLPSLKTIILAWNSWRCY